MDPLQESQASSESLRGARTLVESTPTEGLDYANKPVDYFEHTRPEMLSFIPADCRRLLDVGCGGGAFGQTVKRTRKIEVWGVEPMGSAAAAAATVLDHVVTGSFGPGTDLPETAFDCIVFNDVLEHMTSPEQALRHAKSLLAPGGVIVASIPNIRQLPILWFLAIRGAWEYTDFGLLDKTHLRFFTRSSILAMFLSEGYAVESITGINAYVGAPDVSRRVWTAYRLANALLFGKFDDMKFLQFAVVARLEPAGRDMGSD